jgi:hypothetical protein
VLDHEGTVEAKRLGLDIVLDEIAITFRAVEFATASPCRGAAEQTEPYLYLLVTCAEDSLGGNGRLAKFHAAP